MTTIAVDEQRNDRLILILDEKTRALVDQCHGPDDEGLCPRRREGHKVPCAGRRVVPVYGTGIEGWRLTLLHTGESACPIADLLTD